MRIDIKMEKNGILCFTEHYDDCKKSGMFSKELNKRIVTEEMKNDIIRQCESLTTEEIKEKFADLLVYIADTNRCMSIISLYMGGGSFFTITGSHINCNYGVHKVFVNISDADKYCEEVSKYMKKYEEMEELEWIVAGMKKKLGL